MFALLVALAAGAGLASSTQAATYTVGTLSDLTGTCANPASGSCSLRQLIDYENALATTPNPRDSIAVPAGTYSLTNGELAITQSLAIVGAGARTTHVGVPAGVPAARVFDIQLPPNGGSAPSVTISGLEVSGGTANERNGFFGGDVLNAGSLVLDEDWITEGSASSGGGISNNGGTLLLERSLVSHNHGSTGGGDSGAIQNHGTAVCGAACFPGKKAILTVEDSTVTANDARLGAGIFSWSDAADGNEVTIVNSTIASNTTKEESGGPSRGPGAGLLISDGTAKVAGSLFAFNEEINASGNFTATSCSSSGEGTIKSLGYNIDSSADCGFTATGDHEETFPEFSSGEPQNNGGNTDTLGLEPTSRAVDAIPISVSRCKGVDQRGTARPQGAGCDIGAFELVPLTVRATEGAKFSPQVVTRPPCGVETRVPPTIEWGDGQTSEGTVTETGITGSHTYAEEGTFNGSVSYVNDCGTHKVAFQAKVADAALKGAGVVGAVAEASFSGRVATFSDADPGGTASDYTASIEWGDGTSSTTGTVSATGGGGFEVKGTHTYTAIGQYTTSVTITDAGGAKTTATGSAEVIGAPIVSNVSVISTTETTAKIGFTIDPNGADTTYVINYGLNTSYGQKTTTVDIGSTPGPQSLTKTLTGLTLNSTYHFDVVATNSAAPGGVNSSDKTFTTKPDAPLSATGESLSGTAGTQIKATVATFTDADPTGKASDYTASISWGDGTSSTTGTVNAAAGGGFEVKGTHTYAGAGQYTTSVTITDVGGAKATTTGSANLIGPPVVSNVSVVSVTETTATIAFEIDPAGADTTYVIEYGPDTSYGDRTAPVDIGATHGSQALTRMLTGLDPNKTYHFDVLATNPVAPNGMGAGDRPFTTGEPPTGGGGSASNSNTPEGAVAHSGVLSFQSAKAAVTLADLPPPTLGKSVNVTPVSGVVYIELPPGAKLASASPFSPLALAAQAVGALTKGRGFVPLTEARQIPVGSILDTTAGVVGITTATTASPKGKLQSGDFGAGIFKLLQNRKQRGLTDLDIIDNHSARQVCASSGKARIAAGRPSSKTLGRLNASGHGHFSARGQYSAATVRGTVWSVANRCDGTLTRVKRGVISVRDFHRRKTITLFTGQSYLARAPVKRG